ncbi:PDDEXK nuclease domain-containing protein [Derxia lacustris]|uniref:PDDEXK nuclease domain-containing protein n=1 Tax=Derxia lacustris TaxID=764842 RepID=UPI000A178228|nr:PDDEXK nuclease domain-containing protein [Derxia lacustris]
MARPKADKARQEEPRETQRSKAADKLRKRVADAAPADAAIDALYRDIRELLEQARARVVVQVNQALVLSYWHIGRAIKQTVVTEARADYGDATMQKLADRLVPEFGTGFGRRNLFRMVKLYQCFDSLEIVTTLSAQLSWSHLVELLKVDDPTRRGFYAELCARSRWSVRTLRERMDSLLFERTAIAKQPEEVIRQELAQLGKGDDPSPALFLKDPYLLDFLDLKDGFTEKDLESAILAELERFILELGSDFAFMGRQKRIQVGGHDYYIDLLFFHRRLRRLVLIELKLGEFKPEHKGQVELYLKWLAKHERQPGENAPIAIILCSDKDAEVVELMDLEPDGIHVAEYWLQLPAQEVLRGKLHKALVEARMRLELRGIGARNE